MCLLIKRGLVGYLMIALYWIIALNDMKSVVVLHPIRSNAAVPGFG